MDETFEFVIRCMVNGPGEWSCREQASGGRIDWDRLLEQSERQEVRCVNCSLKTVVAPFSAKRPTLTPSKIHRVFSRKWRKEVWSHEAVLVVGGKDLRQVALMSSVMDQRPMIPRH